MACVLAASVMAACLPLPATTTYQWGQGVSTPTLLTGQQTVKGEIGIDAGKVGNMAINANGTVEAWRLAWGPPGPYQMPVVRSVVQVEDGNDDFVFLEAPSGISPGVCPQDTTVWTVGPNIDGDLGLGDPNNDLYMTPQEVSALDGLGVVQVAAAGTHMFALTCGGKIYEWGDNLQGDLALPTNLRNIASPIVNTGLSNLTGGSSGGVQITTGSYASALLVDGQSYGWGENDLAQCGCGTPAKVVTTPTPVVQNGVSFRSIDAGGNLYNGHTLALDAAGNAYCWGDNQQGECGLGSSGIVPTPTRVPGLPALAQALGGGEYSLFLDRNGTVWACGDNALGQIGNGTTVNLLSPMSVLSGMRMISAGAGHDLAAN
jgi:hypothetical protein